jgi:hypothetical protein
MESLDHITELVDRSERILTRAVGTVRGEETDRSVTPVVDKSGWAILRVELEDRKKFHGGNPESLKIRDLINEPTIGSASLFGDT